MIAREVSHMTLNTHNLLDSLTSGLTKTKNKAAAFFFSFWSPKGFQKIFLGSNIERTIILYGFHDLLVHQYPQV